MDDKCARCGEWTKDAYDRYDGLYNDGTEMDFCQCGFDGIEDEPDDWNAVLWDLGALPTGHPFAEAA